MRTWDWFPESSRENSTQQKRRPHLGQSDGVLVSTGGVKAEKTGAQWFLFLLCSVRATLSWTSSLCCRE